MIAMYMFLETLKFTGMFWGSRYREDLIDVILEGFRSLSRESLLFRHYIPIRGGIDLMVWIVSDNLKPIVGLKTLVRGTLGEYVDEIHSFLAVYKVSQYFQPHVDLRDYIMKVSREPYRYLVAYPMKKSPEWYLLPFEDRRKIMAEHASMARSLSSGRRIRSYTAYSYGVDDNEFLVIYELEDLAEWVDIVEKLREATHRRWVIREEPILVGEYIEDLLTYLGQSTWRA